MSDDIQSRVIKIVSEQLSIEEEKVSVDSRFVEDLGADSLDTVELVMAFEEEFNCEIPDEEVDQIVSVKDAVAYISKRQES